MSSSIPLIRSPLVSTSCVAGDFDVLPVPNEYSQYSGEKEPSPDAHPQVESHDETLFENPQFQHYEETTNIQLFFDLFFVANLTSFTESHEVNSQTSMCLEYKLNNTRC